eukprot:TRINITY_DN9684_c0_g1_i4.p1 TRINITY_DN9684_c0_g1~~TRINITY_DN9684_c0_g1_i4.p1  ORF type:complete len:410 (-),score=55.57 TRINITY_DN9684_c0_g1_i4:1371-2600(-)
MSTDDIQSFQEASEAPVTVQPSNNIPVQISPENQPLPDIQTEGLSLPFPPNLHAGFPPHPGAGLVGLGGPGVGMGPVPQLPPPPALDQAGGIMGQALGLSGGPTRSAPTDPDNMQELLYTHFMDKYRKWYANKYDKPFQFPIFNRTYFDVEKLWNEVMSRGGSSQVCLSKSWAEIGRCFNPPKYMTNLSSIIRSIYERYLLPYELEVSPHTAMPMSNGTDKSRRRRRAPTPRSQPVEVASMNINLPEEFLQLQPPQKKLNEGHQGVELAMGEHDAGISSPQQQQEQSLQQQQGDVGSPGGSGAGANERVVLDVGGIPNQENEVQGLGTADELAVHEDSEAQLRDALRAAMAHIHQLKAHHSQEMQLLQSFYQIRFEQMHARIQALESQLGEARFRYQDMLTQIEEAKRH